MPLSMVIPNGQFFGFLLRIGTAESPGSDISLRIIFHPFQCSFSGVLTAEAPAPDKSHGKITVKGKGQDQSQVQTQGQNPLESGKATLEDKLAGLTSSAGVLWPLSWCVGTMLVLVSFV